VGHTLRSSGLVCVKVSRARVSQSDLKIGGGATASDARDTIVEVASSLSRRQMGRCVGLRRTLLPLFCYFHSIRL
jgi:hypothetical protein